MTPADWLGERTPRERGLAGAVLAIAAIVLVVAGIRAVRADLAARGERVAAAERTLAHVRQLAIDVAVAPGTVEAGDTVLTRLETAAGAVVGRERIASMTPLDTTDTAGVHEERVALRLTGASLGEMVRLLHALEAADPPLPVVRLDLRKHPDDARHFDATIEVSRMTAP
ncbi:MAG TPA: hypothetical protein VGR62_25320 [Candidatus Binatia bacterium]|nr:hypothetical protein [Candidatus Binatia bacterium]